MNQSINAHVFARLTFTNLTSDPVGVFLRDRASLSFPVVSSTGAVVLVAVASPPPSLPAFPRRRPPHSRVAALSNTLLLYRGGSDDDALRASPFGRGAPLPLLGKAAARREFVNCVANASPPRLLRDLSASVLGQAVVPNVLVLGQVLTFNAFYKKLPKQLQDTVLDGIPSTDLASPTAVLPFSLGAGVNVYHVMSESPMDAASIGAIQGAAYLGTLSHAAFTACFSVYASASPSLTSSQRHLLKSFPAICVCTAIAS